MTTKSITSGQEKQLTRFGTDAIGAVLKEMGLSKDAAQRVIAQGGEFQRRVGETVRQALRDLAADKTTMVFPVWKSITLGFHKDAAAHRAALQAGGNRVGDHASQIMEKMEVATAEIVVDLVRLTAREMGFLRGASTVEICAWAEAHGLKKCPAEVGPALRQAFADQPIGEWIHVGMEPIAVSDGRPRVFRVDRDGGARGLGASWTNPTHQWSPGLVWVFVREKK